MKNSSRNALRREDTASGKPACAPHIRRKSASIESQQARAPAQTEITPNPNSAQVVPLSLKPVKAKSDEDLESLTDTTLAYWAKRINRSAEKPAHAFVELGQVLRSAKAKLKHGLWLKMFKTGQVKVHLTFAQRLMKVAGNPALTNAANLPFLPPSPTALVSLSKLPPKAIEAGIAKRRISPSMTIADAGKFVAENGPKPAGDNGDEPKSTTTPGDAAKDFIVVLWDDTDAAPDKLSRAPAKTYSAKNNPNLVSLRLSPQGVVRFDGRTVDGLAELAVFAVELEPSATEPKEIPLIKDKRGTPFCQQTIQFLTLAVRGGVPKPAIFPSQIIPGGYDGVIKMISAMYPTALKVVSTTREQFPPGWEYVPRDKKVGADAALANEQAAAPLADVPKPPAEVPVPKAERGQAVITESTDADDTKEVEVHNREKAAVVTETTILAGTSDSHIEGASQPEPPALTQEFLESQVQRHTADLTAKNNAVIKGDFAQIRRCDLRLQKWYAQLGQKFPECREVSERITQIHADLSYIAAVASESSKALPDTEREQLIRQISASHPKRYAELRRQIEAATLDLRALFKS